MYQELIDIFESKLDVYSAHFKDRLNVGIAIFPSGGDFDLIYSDDDKNPLAILMLGRIQPGEKNSVEELVPRYLGGVFDVSMYVRPEARNKGIAKQLTRTAETLVKAVLKRDGIKDKALLCLVVGIPPEENNLMVGLSRMARDLDYDEVTDRLFLKEVDPTV